MSCKFIVKLPLCFVCLGIVVCVSFMSFLPKTCFIALCNSRHVLVSVEVSESF